MFDRETRRTHLLETRSRFKHGKNLRTIPVRTKDELTEDLSRTTEQFWSIINQEKKRLQAYSNTLEGQSS